MKRFFLFIATNIAIIVVMSIVLSLTGADHFITRAGINYPTLLLFSLIVGFTGSFISLWISKWIAKQAYGIQVITVPSSAEEQWLMETVRDLAKRAKIQMPEVGIYESEEVNAFATGPSRSNSLVAVSSGLLATMNHKEAAGVLAHEVSHISNGDMVTMTLLQGVLNTFVVFLSNIAAFMIDSAMKKSDDDRGPGFGYYIARFLFEIVLGIGASMIAMSFSRYREFGADAGSAKLAGKDSMISALEKLKSLNEHDPVVDDRSGAVSAFKINGKPHNMMALFASHPPLEDRIAALEKLNIA